MQCHTLVQSKLAQPAVKYAKVKESSGEMITVSAGLLFR